MEKATAEIKKWQIALKSCSLNQPQALAVLSARLYLHIISSTILQMNNIEQPLANSKADIVFYRSFTEITRLARFVLVVQLIKVGLLAALIPVDTLSLGVAYGQLIICLILNLVASSLGLLQCLLLVFSVYCNIQTFVSIAVLTNHAISAEPITDSSVLENCVSASIFLAQDSKKEVDLTEQQRDMHKKVTKNMISFSIKQMHGWLPFLENLYEVITFGCMVYTIVVLATTSMPMVDTILLAIYVAVVGLFTTLHLVIGCVIMAVAPAICLLLCLICCCSACCCPNGSLSSKQIDVAEIEATNSQVINAQGSCSICMMSLAVKEKVYVLPCSEKHVFHGQCLRQWTRIKTTCPLCRAEIPARGQENTSQEIGRASLEHQAAEVAQSL